MNSLKQNRCNQNTLSLSLQSLETTNTAFKMIFFFFLTKNKKRGSYLKFNLGVYPSQMSRGPVYRKHTKLLVLVPVADLWKMDKKIWKDAKVTA